ncbi:MAG: CsgG/HfaB family protein [Spirochaetia bacterium]|nr:CsgG/HfaB family protein [Spirochaetia bacterium]
MKYKALWLLVISLAFPAAIFSNDVQNKVEDLVINLTQKYYETHSNILIKKKLGVIPFVNNSENAKKHSVAELITALVTVELQNSTIFSLIERESLEEIIKEHELNQSGLVNDESLPDIGKIESIEVLITGSVAETSDDFIITARIINIETSKIVASSKVELEKNKIITASKEYMRSEFQSKFGVSLDGKATMLFAKDNNIILLQNILFGYRIFDHVKIAFGYSNLMGNELNGITAKDQTVTDTSGTPADHGVTAYYHLEGDGFNFTISGLFSPYYWLNIGTGASVSIYDARLVMNMTDFPVYTIGSGGVIGIENNRITVTGDSHDAQFLYTFFSSVDFLVSKRLSFSITAGYYIFPKFIPSYFYTAGNIRDYEIQGQNGTPDIDKNGTFSEYQNFNFSKNSNGERIKMAFSGFYFELGMSLHF